MLDLRSLFLHQHENVHEEVPQLVHIVFQAQQFLMEKDERINIVTMRDNGQRLQVVYSAENIKSVEELGSDPDKTQFEHSWRSNILCDLHAFVIDMLVPLEISLYLIGFTKLFFWT